MQVQITEENKKKDFQPFKVGTVFNPLSEPPRKVTRRYANVRLKYPSRLEAMAIDPSKIAINDNLRYTPGQIDFCVRIYKTITIAKIRKSTKVVVSNNSPRKTLIQHAAIIMRKALGINEGLKIDVKEEVSLRHCGFGSSSGLIASVACAINELYGSPISDRALVKYLAQNHGEEIDGSKNFINPVQCIGGSAACGTYHGGLVILAGESMVVKTMKISPDYDVVVGVPSDFTYPDSKYLMDMEIKNLPKFLKTGKKYGSIIAYRLFHEVLPELEVGKIQALGDLIFDYRFKMGSIGNCSFVYPPLIQLTDSLAFLKEQGIAEVLTISSVGPGVFVLTKQANICEEAFKERGMNTIRTKIHNSRYKVLEKG